jgi:hypothetical protein
LILDYSTDGRKIGEWWLDRRHQYVLRRIREIDGNGVEIYRMNFTFDYSDDGVLVPSHWEQLEYGASAEVLRHSVFRTITSNVNITIDSSLFDLRFPAKTFVFDAIKRRNYIIGEGGEERPVSRAELLSSMTVEELMETEPGMVVERRQRGPGIWIVLLVCSGVALATVLAWRFVRRQRQTYD